MLTPEYFEHLNENKIIQIYKQLNIDICQDIVSRLTNGGDLSGYTINQLQVLKDTYGDEVYQEVLLKTQRLETEIAQQVTHTYENMARTDLKSYRELYQYREMPLKLSVSQIKILNDAIKITRGQLFNITNTIAFASNQAYVNAVDQAYFDTISGGLSYTDAIKKAVDDLTDKGITLKDSLGRNVKIETAVRRNVLTGVKQCADRVNRDIEEQLGCDGYETTAHWGARPTHQEWQGQQFALTSQGAKKYGIQLWEKSRAKEELNDYNCRHTYYGIILGISEPVYTKSELNALNNAKVTYNGTEIPAYEASQKMNAMKRNLTKYQEKSKALKNNDEMKKQYKMARLKVSEWNKRINDFSKQTGISR